MVWFLKPLWRGNWGLLPQHVFRDGLAALVLKFSGAALSYAMLLSLSWVMDAQEYGVFAIAFSVAMLAGQVSTLGQPLLVLRWRARDRSPRDEGARGAMLRRAYALVLFGSAVAGAASVAVFQPTLAWSGLVVLGALLLIFGLAVAELQSFALRADGQLITALLPRDVLWRLVISSLAIAAFAFGQSVTAGAALVFCGGVLVLCVVLQGRQLVVGAFAAPPDTTDLQTRREQRQSAGWYWISSTTIATFPSAAVIVVGVLLGAEYAGPFFAAVKTAQLLNIVFLSVNLVVAPLSASALERGDVQTVQSLSAGLALLSTAVGSVALLALFVFGSDLLEWFGKGYSSAQPALIILATAFLLKMSFGPSATVLQMGGHEKHATTYIVAASIAMLFTLPLAVLASGANGAALCMALAWGSQSFLCWCFLKRVQGIDSSLMGVSFSVWKARAKAGGCS